jgi:PIN domain nuclease of toxin-antitoxin system
MLIVLDTHAVIWWTADARRLGRAADREITRAERIGISAISLWEIGLLVRKGKVLVDKPMEDWVADLLALPRVECLPLDQRIALRATNLPMHRDPADRFIVATALEHRARLVTKDRALRAQKLVETVW